MTPNIMTKKLIIIAVTVCAVAGYFLTSAIFYPKVVANAENKYYEECKASIFEEIRKYEENNPGTIDLTCEEFQNNVYFLLTPFYLIKK